MQIIYTVFVILGIGFNVFISTQGIGATQAQLDKKKMVAMGIVFGFLEMIMLSVGYGVSILLERSYGLIASRSIDKKLAAIFMIIIGMHVIYQGIQKSSLKECREEPLKWKNYVAQATVVSLKSGVVGACLPSVSVGHWIEAILIWGLTALLATLGFCQGYFKGYTKRKMACWISGVALLSGAAAVLFRMPA